MYDDAPARAYVRHAETKPIHCMYERPGVLGMLPARLGGERVLDAGCGGGWLSDAVRTRGGRPTAIDASSTMIALARKRLGPGADIRQADLAARLPFDDRTFDRVVSSLTLHYLHDLTGGLRELARVAAPQATLAVSMHHPCTDARLADDADYFTTRDTDDVWTFGGVPLEVRYVVRPLSAIFDALYDAGWANVRIHEPRPDPAMADADPVWHRRLRTHPWFLFFTAERAA